MRKKDLNIKGTCDHRTMDWGTFYNLFVKQNNLINEINELLFLPIFERTSPFCLRLIFGGSHLI